MPRWHRLTENITDAAFAVGGTPRNVNKAVAVRVRIGRSIWKIGNLCLITREGGEIYHATCTRCLPHHEFVKHSRWVDCARLLAEHYLEYHRRS